MLFIRAQSYLYNLGTRPGLSKWAEFVNHNKTSRFFSRHSLIPLFAKLIPSHRGCRAGEQGGLVFPNFPKNALKRILKDKSIKRENRRELYFDAKVFILIDKALQPTTFLPCICLHHYVKVFIDYMAFLSCQHSLMVFVITLLSHLQSISYFFTFTSHSSELNITPHL